METYTISPPTAPKVPILLSIPHCGTAFPDEIRDQYVPELIAAPDDTDWFVDRLYDFAPSMGITVIAGVLSRWVIDLNRDPQNKPLYNDGRIITSLCPVTTFAGEPLYKDARKEVDNGEVTRRRKLYFEPYHRKLTALLNEMKAEFGEALLWDCHSIRHIVPSIRKERFPDLILGSADATSASAKLIETALNCLGGGPYSLSHNHPFKGGYITRHYGKPAENIHALQLEMNKINYMDDSETMYDTRRAKKTADLLNKTLSELSRTLLSPQD